MTVEESRGVERETSDIKERQHKANHINELAFREDSFFYGKSDGMASRRYNYNCLSAIITQLRFFRSMADLFLLRLDTLIHDSLEIDF
jgi:hypothetical protein